MKKVSIIVPIYNTEKYLNKCIDSLLNQTEKNIEIILINDGSTDNSEQLIKSYNDKRIKYIKKENTGIGKTRNLGIKKSNGEYLMFIDSDDYIHPMCVEKMYKKAIKDQCDLVISDYFEDRNGKITTRIVGDFKDSSLIANPSILNQVNLGPCNKLYKKEVLNNILFEEKLKYEDAPFVIKVLNQAKKIGKLNEPLSYYVIHENSQTTTMDERVFDVLEICKIIIKTLDNKIYKDNLTNLMVMILTDYTIQVRNLKNTQKRNIFINEAFEILNNLNKNWRKCNYLKKYIFYKRYIKTNKQLTKLYCKIYQILK